MDAVAGSDAAAARPDTFLAVAGWRCPKGSPVPWRFHTPLPLMACGCNERRVMRERPIVVFDVNETLLDLDAIRPVFERIFNDPAALRLWFAHLITYSEALTLSGVYVPFTDIGGAVLRMLAATRDITISDADTAELTDRFAAMPPHPEVPAALRRLHDHGFRTPNKVRG
ncbi:(S)-2-haloacid dehalogenase [Streptomyces sp. MBT84]|nr:(S)-2-haloacid dehalogenase [Streptomyces sp. MBT84]